MGSTRGHDCILVKSSILAGTGQLAILCPAREVGIPIVPAPIDWRRPGLTRVDPERISDDSTVQSVAINSVNSFGPHAWPLQPRKPRRLVS